MRNSSLDLICFAATGRKLSVLVRRGSGRTRDALPWTNLDTRSPLSSQGTRLAKDTTGKNPGWIAQAGVFGDGLKHPSDGTLSIAFVTVVPRGTDAPEGYEWRQMNKLSVLGARQKAMVEAALDVVRDRMDREPVAFKMLPATFSLTDLQDIYELLLERFLHKASFRRSLLSASVVSSTKEWRSEGRGRPAQLYRYNPSKRRKSRRMVRFELLS